MQQLQLQTQNLDFARGRRYRAARA